MLVTQQHVLICYSRYQLKILSCSWQDMIKIRIEKSDSQSFVQLFLQLMHILMIKYHKGRAVMEANFLRKQNYFTEICGWLTLELNNKLKQLEKDWANDQHLVYMMLLKQLMLTQMEKSQEMNLKISLKVEQEDFK